MMTERFKKWLPLLLMIAVVLYLFKPWQRRGTDTLHMVHVSQTNFVEQVEQADIPVLVDFWAAWCGPCRILTPVLDDLAEEYAGRVVFAKVNVDEETALAERFRVQSIPNVYLFVNGKPVDSFLGVRSKATVRTWLEKHL